MRREVKVRKANNVREEWRSGWVRRDGRMMYVSLDQSSAPQYQPAIVYLILHSFFGAA